MEATLDKSGRIVIPKKIRNDLGLKPGIRVEIEEQEDKVVIRPLTQEIPLESKDGVLVYAGVATGDLEESMKTLRESRLKRIV